MKITRSTKLPAMLTEIARRIDAASGSPHFDALEHTHIERVAQIATAAQEAVDLVTGLTVIH